MRFRRLTTVILAVLAHAGCKRAAIPGESPQHVQVSVSAKLPGTSDDPLWKATPIHRERLIPQDMVDPRLMVPSTREVEIQALSNGKEVVFRVAWSDETKDDLPDTGRFTDACAVQLPTTAAADLPAPQMGEVGKPVEIAYWSATMQAAVDGRPDTIAQIHPNTPPIPYPFEAAPMASSAILQEEGSRRYAPAKAVGNIVTGPHATPIQDLIAEGPGSLRPAPKTISQGKGTRGQHGWNVVIRRPWPATLAGVHQTQAAFAVWDGSRGEVGSRKMRTAWVPVSIEVRP